MEYGDGKGAADKYVGTDYTMWRCPCNSGPSYIVKLRRLQPALNSRSGPSFRALCG